MGIGDRARVNHELRKLGFGSLDDPNLIPQIAMCIRDHDQFRNQLFSVLPEKRRLAYEQLRPHLRFQAKPLDVYEAEMKQRAEREQWDVIDPANPVYPQKFAAGRLSELAEEAIKQNAHEVKGFLELICTACTKAGLFRAKIRKDAEKEAQSEGWRWAEKNGQMKTYCPEHVPGRCKMTLRCIECPRVDVVHAWDEQDGYTKARLSGWVIQDEAKCPRCAVEKLVIQ